MLSIQTNRATARPGISKPLQRLRDTDTKSERDFAQWILQVVEDVVEGRLPPTQADVEVTALLKSIDEDRNIVLSEPAEELLFEVQTIHDYGNDFGCDVDRIRSLAAQVR